jgi:hypothetical protein
MFLRKRTLSLLAATTVLGVLVPSAAEAVVADKPATGYPAFDGAVRTIAHRGSTVYVGGDFDNVTGASGTVTRHGAAAINVKTGRVLAWNPNVGGQVRDLAVTKEGVYLVGKFSSVRGKARRNFARVDLGGRGRVQKVRLRTNGRINTVTVNKTRVYLGGGFTTINGKTRYRLAAVSRSGAGLVRGWQPKAHSGEVNDIVVKRSGVYVAGDFRTLNRRKAYQRLAELTKRRGAIVRSFNPDTSRTVLDIAVGRHQVYAAIGGLHGGGAQAVGRRKGGTVWNRRFDGDVQAITSLRGQVYVGGHFNEICDPGTQQDPNGTCLAGSTRRRRGLSLNGDGSLGAWSPQANGNMGIYAFSTYGRAERLLVGGDFTTFNDGSTSAKRFAVFR